MWWLAAGVLVAAELATGTFYLLMLSLGMAAAAIGSHIGWSFAAQLIAAAVVGAGAVVGWHLRRRKLPKALPAGANRDVNLDIGERVQVKNWSPDGSARIQYRGASWDARFIGSGVPESGEYVIRALDGNRLLLDK